MVLSEKTIIVLPNTYRAMHGVNSYGSRVYRNPSIHPSIYPLNLIELKSLFIHEITNRYVLICVLKRVT